MSDLPQTRQAIENLAQKLERAGAQSKELYAESLWACVRMALVGQIAAPYLAARTDMQKIGDILAASKKPST